jgi:hypothetical protein
MLCKPPWFAPQLNRPRKDTPIMTRSVISFAIVAIVAVSFTAHEASAQNFSVGFNNGRVQAGFHHGQPNYCPPKYCPPVYRPPVICPPVYRPPVICPPVYRPPVVCPPVYCPPPRPICPPHWGHHPQHPQHPHHPHGGGGFGGQGGGFQGQHQFSGQRDASQFFNR